MRLPNLIINILLILISFSEVFSQNELSSKEQQEGWQLLFNGKNFEGWRGAYKEHFPDSGWAIVDGCLSKIKSKGGESRAGGDIVTKQTFSNFELVVDWKITKEANSGIKYFVTEFQPKPPGSAIGLEFQILDDENHPDAKLGKNGNRKAGSLYDLIPAPTNKKLNPVGEWNTARIVSKGNHVEHWLNGEKTIEYERGSETFKNTVAESKYKIWKNFGEAKEGHILLQDHGDEVFFRNIKIRKL